MERQNRRRGRQGQRDDVERKRRRLVPDERAELVAVRAVVEPADPCRIGTSAAAITGAKTTSATKTGTNPARRRGTAALSSRSIGYGQMWIAWPSAPSVPSSDPSDRVG